MTKTTAVARRGTSAVARSKKALSAEDLILKAIEHGTPIDTMKELLAMKEKLDAETARRAYFSALADFQKECPQIVKRKAVKNKAGDKTVYRYAPLDDILKTVSPLLERHGFSYTIKSEDLTEGQIEKVKSTTVVHHRLGHSEQTSFAIPVTKSEYISLQQSYGVSSMYSKRYSFCNALGILTTDEDTDGAMPTQKTPKPEVQTVGAQQVKEMRSMFATGEVQDAVVVPAGDSQAILEQVTALIKQMVPTFGDRAKFKQKDKDRVFYILRDCFNAKTWAEIESMTPAQQQDGLNKMGVIWDIQNGR